MIFVPNIPESEGFGKKYLLVKNCFRRPKATYLCLIKPNLKDFEKKIFWSKTNLIDQRNIFVPNYPEFEGFWKKHLLVKNCFRRSKARYLCLINLNLKDFKKNNFWLKTSERMIFVPNKPESEGFWKKNLLVKNCFRRSKAWYLCLINLNLKDLKKISFGWKRPKR